MRVPFKLEVATVLFGLCLVAGAQQEGGMWRADSKSARSITGDISLSNSKITINFMQFTIVRMRGLENAEISAVFNPDTAPDGTGSLYRLDIDGMRKFLHKNTLCGNENVEWMATYASSRSLEVAFFSGEKQPVMTAEALMNSTDMCGTYTYAR